MPTQKPTLLIVDDNPDNLTVLGELLCEHYRVRAANSGPRALALALQTPAPELILLDVMMPMMNGHQVLVRLQADPATRGIPVIFVSAMDATEDEHQGLALGAVDYITKPLRPAIVLARVRTHIELKQARDRLQGDKAALEAEIARRMRENLLVQDVTIRALARLAETRDNETGHHIVRTQLYVERLARLARHHPRFKATLDDATIALMAKSAPLHDIGKVGIPDHVLLKPGKLDAAEWAIMKTHAQLGAAAISGAEADAEASVQFLVFAKQIALSHHERWDGGGYPQGLAGDAIPLAARLMAIADVFDALISRRVYKAPMPIDKVHAIMADQGGLHFDPDLLAIFIEGFDGFREIASRYPDEAPDEAAAEAVVERPAAALAGPTQPAPLPLPEQPAAALAS